MTPIASATNSPLAGQVAVITGAGRGTGRAIAVRLAELGAHAVLGGRSRQALEQTAALIQNAGTQSSEDGSKESTVVECDVTDLDSVAALAQQVESAFHRLDILVNNAGIFGAGAPGPLHQLAPENWDRVLNTNLRGVYYCIRSLAPLMINSKARSGHIINISSLAGKNALPNGAAYAAKMGIERINLFRSRGITPPQHSRRGNLPRIHPHRVQPASRKERREDAASLRRSARSSYARDPIFTSLRQRNPAAPNPEAITWAETRLAAAPASASSESKRLRAQTNS